MLSMGHAPENGGFPDEQIDIRSLLPRLRNHSVEKWGRRLKTPDAIRLYL